MADITQTISTFPPAPDSATDTPTEFNSKSDAFVNHQASVYVGEVNQWTTEANGLKSDMNQVKADIDNIVATIPAGSIDDVNISSTNVFSNQKTEATYAKKESGVTVPTFPTDEGRVWTAKSTGNQWAEATSSGGVAGVGFDFYGTTAPIGSFACNGQAVSRTTYAKLFAAIGTTWGAGDGSTTFNLPIQEVDGLGLYNRGVGSINGAVGTYQDDVFKAHNHNTGGVNIQSGTGTYFINTGDQTPNSTTALTGDPTETRPRSITVLKCIWHGE